MTLMSTLLVENASGHSGCLGTGAVTQWCSQMTLWMGCLNRSVRILNAAASILLIKPAHQATSPAFKTVHTNTDVWRTVHWVLEVPAVWSMKWFVVRLFFNVSNQKNLISYINFNIYRRCISLHEISSSVFIDSTFTVVKHQSANIKLFCIQDGCSQSGC